MDTYKLEKPIIRKRWLICERIFGLIKSEICACGNYRVTGDKKEDQNFMSNAKSNLLILEYEGTIGLCTNDLCTGVLFLIFLFIISLLVGWLHLQPK